MGVSMELTSPLTTLASISTPGSYYTAHNSPSNGADDTSLSSPVDDQPPPAQQRYRKAVQLPHELKSHCQIHLEEQLYAAAIQILSGLLSDGAASSPTTTATTPHLQRKPNPALIPPPSQIALLATLIIHPSFTSRAPETSNIHAASHALAYLRGLLSTIGPINANFRAALHFNNTHTYPGGGHSRTANNRQTTAGGGGGGSSSSSSNNSTGTCSADESDDTSATPLSGPFQLLFGGGGQGHGQGQRRGLDFWSVLGWAFRCAAEYPHRWRHWRVWLEFVVSVAEADLDERLARDQETADRVRAAAGGSGSGSGSGGKGRDKGGGKKRADAPPEPSYPLLGQSLMVGYLEGLKRERKNCVKEVLRGLFAFSDGENAVSDRAMFREVFEREVAAGRGAESKRKREEELVVDLENDQFGDYLDGDGFGDDEEEEGEEDRVPTPLASSGRRKPGRKAKETGTASFTLTDGIAETVPFRLRIFRLLSAVSCYLPETFAPAEELYERFIDHVRGLPLPMFRLFVESRQCLLPEDVQISFLQMVIENMLPRHPDPADIDPDGNVTMLVMQECFLPFAANKVTAEDNAKLSLALESMTWFVYSHMDEEYSAELRKAVEKGIKAREDKIKKRGAGAGRADTADKVAREALARSARNLRALVDVITIAEK